MRAVCINLCLNDVKLLLYRQQSTNEEMPSTTVGRTNSPESAAAVSAVSGAGGYDVTRMCEEEFERLTVYIVPDVPCERGTSNRAEKTLPRSLALRPSAVLSTPNTPVCTPLNFLKPAMKSVIKFLN